MSTPNRRTLVSVVAPLLTAATLLGAAAPAGALPTGPGGLPASPKPVARLTISPNPALAGTQLTTAAVARRVRVRVGAGVVGPDIAAQGRGDVVTFDASASSDDNGRIVAYQWDLDGNGIYERTTTSPTTSRTYTTTGLIAVHLRVLDQRGQVSPVVTQSLRLHHAPRAVIWLSKTDALVGEPVTVSGGGSTDDDGIATLLWDFDDDGAFDDWASSSVSTIAKPHFTTVGPHVIRLRVTDIYGATSIASATITVHAVASGS